MEATLDAGLEQVEQSQGGDGGEQQQQQAQPDPKQADREYSSWIKGLKEDGDSGKHYRRIKDDFSRLQTLNRLDPKGIDGVRERYAALDGVAYGDKKGIEAISTMQSALAQSQTALDAIAQGDLTQLDDDQRAGMSRMAPKILDMLADSDADGYTKALLPHFVDALKGSQLYSAFGSLVDTLSQKPPLWMKPEQKADWINDRLQAVLGHATTMGQWFKAQEDRVKEMGGADKDKGASWKDELKPGPPTPESIANQQFWKDNVYPETNTLAEKIYDAELKPWADKLAKAGFRLSDAKKQALAGEFVQGVIAKANKNEDYKSQMSRYNRQRTPDKSSVVSLFRSEFSKHAPDVMKALIERDYGQILDKRTAPKANSNGNGNGAKTAPIAPQAGVKIVSVKPSRADIDFPRTPADWLYQNKWRLRNGTVVQYRP
jgi:hypothetical protein